MGFESILNGLFTGLLSAFTDGLLAQILALIGLN
jgi:hypothetical protein